MKEQEAEFADLRTLAIKYGSTKQDIRDTARKLIEQGYTIDVLAWGGTSKIKINHPQFRAALLKAYRATL